MHNHARIAALLLFAAFPAFAYATSGTAAASESTITVTGAGIPGETYRLAQIYGDWFVTAKDAHASLTMRTVGGAHRAQLGIEWDGKGLTQTIDAAKNDDIHSSNQFSFSLHLTGTGAYNQSAQLRGSNAITVTITKMDNLTLEATINGTATGAGPLRLTGVIKLHRDAAANKPTGTFGNCDPDIHDKLAGAEWRSPSECEVKFDIYVRQVLASALAPVVNHFTQAGWTVVKQSEKGPINSIARHSEGTPFKLESSAPGAVEVKLALRTDSPIYQQYNKLVMDAMQKFSDVLKSASAAGATSITDALHDAAKAQEEHTTIAISIVINEASVEITSFKGGHTVTALAGGSFTVSAPFVQQPTGGDVSGAQQVTYVFLGAFSPPAGSGPGTGSENIQVRGTLNPANRMAVQNIRIRIQTGTELAQQVIKLIDGSALQQLLAGR